MSRILAALLAAIFCFNAAAAVAATTGIVRGNISVSGAPKAGVKLTLKGEGSLLQTTTDTGGNYLFAQVPFGDYSLSANYPGVAEKTVAVTVQSDQVQFVRLALGELRTIATVTTSVRGGVSGTPVSQNILDSAQLATSPVNNSLNRVLETVPGVVRFSYNEPVAHGFHGVTYEIDGAPLPLATSANFAEIIDPKNVDSIEIFTGAMPAEFGGSRQGAVINIISNRPSDLSVPYQGSLTAGGGNYGQKTVSFDNSLKTGKTAVFFNANTQADTRGLDAPSLTSTHDNSSKSDQFLRVVSSFNPRQSLAFNFSNQLAQFQIPINADPNNVYDPTVSLPGTDDVQREYDRFASLNFTSISKGGNSVFQFIPWVRSTRVAFDGDLANDVLGLTNLGACSNLGLTDPTCTANPNAVIYQSAIGLRQDRRANYVGLRTSQFTASEHHAIKIGVDVSREIFSATQTFACYDPSCVTQTYTPPLAPAATPGYTAFTTQQNQAGTQAGIYAEDKWTPSHEFSVSYGLRYDHSTGYAGGNQLSPRIGVNAGLGSRDVVHAYYGRFYAAPQLEDVRQACVVLQGCPSTPVYDLQPETDSYAEFGVAHTFGGRTTGYLNAWTRSVNNVLDTTQLLNTPLFAVFNNTIGRAHGYELRLQHTIPNADSWFVSGTWSSSQAAGISGSTFLFPPSSNSGGSLLGQLQPEDHDQTVAANLSYTHRFGLGNSLFTTLLGQYGGGYPVSFEGIINGGQVSFTGRLPSHSTLDWSIGREAGRNGDHRLGLDLDVNNLFNDRYVIKIANGFNTTQIAQGRTILLRLTAPF